MKSTLSSVAKTVSLSPFYKEIAFYLLLLGGSLYVLTETLELRGDTRLLPLLFLSFLIAMIVLKLGFLLYDQRYGLPKTITDNSSGLLEEFLDKDTEVRTVRQLRMVGWVIGATLLVYLLGHLLAIPLFIFLFVFLESDIPLRTNLALSVGMLVAIYLIFVQLLSMRMYEGVISLVPLVI